MRQSRYFCTCYCELFVSFSFPRCTFVRSHHTSENFFSSPTPMPCYVSIPIYGDFSYITAILLLQYWQAGRLQTALLLASWENAENWNDAKTTTRNTHKFYRFIHISVRCILDLTIQYNENLHSTSNTRVFAPVPLYMCTWSIVGASNNNTYNFLLFPLFKLKVIVCS